MNEPKTLLDYMKTSMPDYPFDPQIDGPFVCELIADFDHINILEEAKAFRWYHDNNPAKRYRNLRLAFRRWLSNAWAREHNGVT